MSTRSEAFGARRGLRGAALPTVALLVAVLGSQTGCYSYVSGGYSSGGASYNSLQQSPASAPPPQSPPPPPPPPFPPMQPPLPPLGRNEPYFDPMTPRNVTALVGKSAYLSCRVRNLGNKTVSWIRHRDIHILTVGSYTYTSDQRFQAIHHTDNEEWTLQIKWAQKRDAGIYECQISTQPHRSYFVALNVVVPTATILGAPDLHVDKGSTINLTCIIKYSPEPPAYIFWYHHDEVISYDSNRGGVSVITEKGEVTTSYLLIQHALLSDSGKYSCSPSNADVASVRVHVLNGERPAAMQTGSAGLSNSSYNILTLMALCLFHSFLVEEFLLNGAPWAGKASGTAGSRLSASKCCQSAR
ncbi:immunoglobulin superfamily DCC subclass member 3-like isoform X4 [Ischnura elegans]|uniref:immunoglobulin superfamily DCC subclass member 3-like isoform X4 n=1 Tax=Ischnura elegans TaxID=197161 RepID=UPI001ED87A2C|nr:immunoglobulin superfamily DCC subclass member 3-like isoform X4 [Ischnura elegans]